MLKWWFSDRFCNFDERIMDQQVDQRADGPTDQKTNIAFYRDANAASERKRNEVVKWYSPMRRWALLSCLGRIDRRISISHFPAFPRFPHVRRSNPGFRICQRWTREREFALRSHWRHEASSGRQSRWDTAGLSGNLGFWWIRWEGEELARWARINLTGQLMITVSLYETLQDHQIPYSLSNKPKKSAF